MTETSINTAKCTGSCVRNYKIVYYGGEVVDTGSRYISAWNTLQITN